MERRTRSFATDRGVATITITIAVAAALYTVFAMWMIKRLHTPVAVTFAELTDYVDDDARASRLASHPYLKWTAARADRKRAGVVLHDRSAAWPGYNLFTDDKQHVLLVDMDGNVVHAWRVNDYHWAECALIRPSGDALVVCVADGLVKLDRYSRKRWEYREKLHHEVAEDLDGNLIVLGIEDRDYKGKPVPFDFIDFITADGRFVKRWSTYDNLQALQQLHGPAPVDLGKVTDEFGAVTDDYYHLNAVQVLPDTPLGRADVRFQQGNYLLCLRNVNLIVVLDRRLRPVWHWGERILDLPHMPRMLPTGNILVFDNGQRRGHSRIVELNPATEEIVWEYAADPPEAFFSPLRGSNQRLPNGNTLVCSSGRGRVFEVTAAGRVVWEFCNPVFNARGQRRGIYRCVRLAPAEVEPFLTMAREGGLLIREPIDRQAVVLLVLPLLLLGLLLPLRRAMRRKSARRRW